MDTYLWLLLLVVASGLMFILGRVLTVPRPRSIPSSRAVAPGSLSGAEQVLDQMTEGVILLSESATPRFANAAARRLLGLPLSELPPQLPSDEIASLGRRAAVDQTSVQNVVRSANGGSLRIDAIPLAESGDVVLFLRDVTDELATQQIRRQFVANASHELKTPVASLQALAEAIRAALPRDLSSAERFADRLIIESDRMSRLIQGLLDLSKLEDPIAFSTELVDLSKLARHESELVEGPAADKGLKLQVDIDDGVEVEGDPDQLSLMIRNLLDNALRYTPSGGTIGLFVSRDDGSASVEVVDTGIGIALSAQARVFERFFRADPDRSRESGGTGLGLAIVRHVAELHAGHVSLSSDLGEGSTFTVKLPAAPEVSSAEPHA